MKRRLGVFTALTTSCVVAACGQTPDFMSSGDYSVGLGIFGIVVMLGLIASMVEGKLNNLDSRLGEITSGLEEIGSDVAELKTAISLGGDGLEAISSRLDDIRSEVQGSLDSRLGEITSGLEEIGSDVAELNTAISQSGDGLAVISSRLDDVRSEVQGLERTLDRQVNRLSGQLADLHSGGTDTENESDFEDE